MEGSLALRAQLSRRIRVYSPPEWSEFTSLWIALNTLYGGEADARERARLMGAVRRYVSVQDARHILQRNAAAISKLIDLPPGDMRLERWNPRFRAASARCVRRYTSRSETPRGRLAGAAGVLYQVRCNLIHGSKDPSNPRDRMLVRESVVLLRDLVPALERGLLHANA
jgi:hypothetical protein